MAILFIDVLLFISSCSLSTSYFLSENNLCGYLWGITSALWFLCFYFNYQTYKINKETEKIMAEAKKHWKDLENEN